MKNNKVAEKISTHKFYVSAGYPNHINYTVYINAIDYESAIQGLHNYLCANDILLARIIRHSISKGRHLNGHKLGFR